MSFVTSKLGCSLESYKLHVVRALSPNCKTEYFPCVIHFNLKQQF